MGQAADSLSTPKVKNIVENSLEISNVVLMTLNDAVSMAPVPYLQQAAGLALGILNTVQGAKNNRDAFQKLAADTCELVYVVLRMSEEAFEEGDDCGLIDNLQDLLGALSSTKRFLCKEVSRGPTARLLRSKTDLLGKIQEYCDALRRPLYKSLLQSNVAMRKTLLLLERDKERKDSEAASSSVSAPAVVDKDPPPVPPMVTDETPKPSVTVTHIGGDEVYSHSLGNVTNTNFRKINTMQGAPGVTVSGGNFDGVSEDMVVNDSSSHTTNCGSFNTMNSGKNSTRNDFSRIMAHNFHAGTVNNYNGAKDVNMDANYGSHPNVVVPAYLISNLTINQNDHRGAIPSREPYALQRYNYQRSRGQGSRPLNHHAYFGPPAGHYCDEQEHYYNDSAYGRPRGARRYQDRARYWPSSQGSHTYQVDSRGEEISSWATEDAYPGDGIYSDEGEEFNPHGPMLYLPRAIRHHPILEVKLTWWLL